MDRKRRTPWRIARQIAVCMLLGALVTVVVAWGLALSMKFPPGAATLTETGNLAWPIHVPARWAPANERTIWRVAGLRYGAWVSRPPDPRWTHGAGPQQFYVDEATFGWPWPSLTAAFARELEPQSQGGSGWTSRAEDLPRSAWIAGVPVPAGVPVAKSRAFARLPIRPRWAPFVADTAFFAVPFALVWLGVSAALRYRRRSRGRCGDCSYSLAGLPADAPCPECGMPRR